LQRSAEESAELMAVKTEWALSLTTTT
jgi:hypothetical protein